MLSSAEAGEDAARKFYESALEDGRLPEYLAPIARCQLARIKAAHDRVRNLRDIKAA